jgi:cytochrome P450
MISMSQEAVVAPVVHSPKTLPPGPRGLNVLWEMLRSPHSSLDFLVWTHQHYGDMAFFRLLTIPVCVVTDPAAIEQVLVAQSHNFTKSRGYKALHAILGEGLLTSEGDLWKRHRRLVQPAFFRERIAAYAPMMTAAAGQVADGWQDGEVRDIHADMVRLTLEIAGKTLFDVDTADIASTIGKALTVGMEEFFRLTSVRFLIPDWLMVLGRRRFRRALGALEEVVYRIIRERRASGKQSSDLLSLLLQAREEDGSGLSDKELRDEVMTLLLAGHETTANTLSYTLYLLAQNPEAEERLYAELREVLNGRPAEASDMRRLPYTEMVLKESMRLYPPAWAIGRKAISAFELLGYQFPAGTNVVMPQWIVHRDARYYPNPERFEPERWRELADPRALPKFAYLPFGGGPRVCVGASLALTEATVVLAAFAQRFRFRLVSGEPLQLMPSVTLRPKHGIRMRLEKRSAPAS